MDNDLESHEWNEENLSELVSEPRFEPGTCPI
jgi:hypothetical protein